MSDYIHIPHPGGSVDMTHRADMAATDGVAIPVNEPSPVGGFVVPVRQDNPEECIPRTVQLGASNNTYLPLLPMDMQRRRAVIVPVNNDIWISENKDRASQAAGINPSTGYSMAAHIPSGTNLVVESRGELWVSSTTAATTSIAVIVERYAEPLP